MYSVHRSVIKTEKVSSAGDETLETGLEGTIQVLLDGHYETMILYASIDLYLFNMEIPPAFSDPEKLFECESQLG